MVKALTDILPVYGVEHDAILSKQGDITIALRVDLPEIFTLSDQEYEAFHHSWIKAIKVLPVNAILHKQDWFTENKHAADFTSEDQSFLSKSSERFFNERPYLDHECYIMLTKKPAGRKIASSIFSNLLRRTIVPEETLQPKHLHDFLNHAGQFERILSDSGFIKLAKLNNDELIALLEKYMNLQIPGENFILRDIEFENKLQIGEQHLQLYTMCDAENVPALCGSRINYDKYSTDRTKFSVGFASPIGQLLSCNHIYNQYIFINDVQKTIQKIRKQKIAASVIICIQPGECHCQRSHR